MSKTVNNADQINAVITTNGDATASVDFTPTQDTHVVNKAYVDTAIGNIPAPVPVANPNLLINGGFDVWQRGTTDTAGNVYLADRWKGVSGNQTMGRSTDIPSETSMFNYSIVMVHSTATPTIRQGIELNNNGLARATPFEKGAAYTLSYWAKIVEGGLTTYQINYRDVVGSGTNAVALIPTTVAATLTADTWTFVTATFVLPNTNPNTTNTSLEVQIQGGTTGNTFRITGVKLEQGSVATPWFYEDYGTTLRKCQRYFYRLGGRVANAYVGSGFQYSTTSISLTCKHPATMREVPTISFSDPTTGFQYILDSVGNCTGATATAGAVQDQNTMALSFTKAATNAQGDGAQIRFRDINSYIDVDAEL